MRITKLPKEKYFNPFGYESYETYKACLLGKMIKTHITGKSERSKELLGLINTNVYGPMTIHAINKYIYFIIFFYDHSRNGYVYLMKHMSKSFERFKKFRIEVENKLERVSKYFDLVNT